MEIKRRLVWLTRMLEKHYSGDTAKEMVAERNRRAGDALRQEKDQLFHRDLARSMADEPRASVDEVTELSTQLNVAQRSVVPPWETPSWFKLFRHVDADGSGLISYAEFVDMVRDVLRLAESQMPELRLKALWLALDTDCSGYLTSGEFGAFMRLGEVAAERISGLERRHALALEARRELETRAADEVRFETTKVRRDLEGPEQRVMRMASKLRACPRYRVGHASSSSPSQHASAHKRTEGIRSLDPDENALAIDEWLERAYAARQQQLATLVASLEHTVEEWKLTALPSERHGGGFSASSAYGN
jgi:hypothetical protein